MFFSEFITGLILIIAGVLVKSFPNLIAGYNTMSKSEKENVDIDGLSKMMHDYLIGFGIAVILIGVIFYFLNLKASHALLFSSTIIVIAIVLILFTAQKYYKKQD